MGLWYDRRLGLLRCDALLSSSYTFSAMGRRLIKNTSLEGEWDCNRSPIMAVVDLFVFLARLLHKVSAVLMGVVYVLMLVCHRNLMDAEWLGLTNASGKFALFALAVLPTSWLTLLYSSIEGDHQYPWSYSRSSCRT